jgi:flavodoxin
MLPAQESPPDLSRRVLLASLAGLPLTGAAGAADDVPSAGNRSRILVAFFSRSGNTRVIAGLIQRALRADLFEIVPATPYPADYLQTVEQATRERSRDFAPPLASALPDVNAYDTVYLGFPIWGETAPPVIRSFLKAHDLAGKNLVPFITHGGYGAGRSHALLRSQTPKARMQTGFLLQADQERQSMNAVNAWLEESGAAAPRKE